MTGVTDRSFDLLLYQGAAQLPPEAVGQKPPTPWREPLWRVCWGLALTTITLNFLYLQYILPALGVVLLYLGFRALWRENGWFQLGYGLSALLLLGRGTVTVLQATPATQWLSSQYGSLVGVALSLGAWLLYFALWRGLKGVFRKGGQTPRTRSAGGLVVWYGLVLLLALVDSAGPLIWLLLLLWVLLLRGLYRTSRALDQAGYAIAPAPVRFSEQRVILVWLGLLLAAVLTCLFLFRRFPVNASPTRLEAGQETLRAELVDLGFPEEVLADLTDEEVALLEGADSVVIQENFSSPASAGWDSADALELQGLNATFLMVTLPSGRAGFVYWFSWDQPPRSRLTDGLEVLPSMDFDSQSMRASPKGRLLWQQDGQTLQAELAPARSGSVTSSSPVIWGDYSCFDVYVSLPDQGTNIRGYLVWTLDGFWTSTNWNAQVNYVHQTSPLIYPWQPLLEVFRSHDGLVRPSYAFEYLEYNALFFYPVEGKTEGQAS